ncbi:type II secretion system F family protein [Brevibacillus laterosporus]|uniref:Type II secretion system F family protein n=1 Tax=Brevibacillus laterosporus TaxID=1465 RepID=A0AAP3DJA1_BRELA|nr:type II secretion system F family protein [Brevibacillus laterosporus]MCR8980960.1 type II secretion system F family protein [Brevibacillus laterosporus]MCZ0808115.1 type II secretion system F family protein [Brevibacillus laterosporus]MCZ0826307.1 type II secretion system F family protein [Brevibacillus laterosporus]MCZ0850190.1 type II secretion system F family protein [Brevibacillus laterosporus]MED1663690.1 type II secretion system F family protein [Brevibacillus laterosporus]
MALFASISIGILVIMIASPFFYVVNMGEKTNLFTRFMVEEQKEKKEKRLFSRDQRIILWMTEPKRLDALARRLGFDLLRVDRQLQRLRWTTKVEEWFVLKALGALFLGCAVFLLGYRYLRDGEVDIFQKIGLILSLLLYFSPNLIINWYDKRAQREIEVQIPIFFSIVLALVEAGMPVHSAMSKAASRYPKRLGQEIARLEVEQKRYGNWRKALEELALRWELASFLSIVTDIQEAVTKGTSIAHLLRMHIEEQLRREEDQMTNEVNRMSVRLLPLVVLFMGVPLMFLVLGPSFIGIKNQL